MEKKQNIFSEATLSELQKSVNENHAILGETKKCLSEYKMPQQDTAKQYEDKAQELYDKIYQRLKNTFKIYDVEVINFPSYISKVYYDSTDDTMKFVRKNTESAPINPSNIPYTDLVLLYDKVINFVSANEHSFVDYTTTEYQDSINELCDKLESLMEDKDVSELDRSQVIMPQDITTIYIGESYQNGEAIMKCDDGDALSDILDINDLAALYRNVERYLNSNI